MQRKRGTDHDRHHGHLRNEGLKDENFGTCPLGYIPRHLLLRYCQNEQGSGEHSERQIRDDSTVEEKHSRRIPPSVKQTREQSYSPLCLSKEHHGRRGEKAEEEMEDKNWVCR